MSRAPLAARLRRVGFAALTALCMAGPALADPTRMVTAPAGWRGDPEQGATLAQRFAATTHFGGLPTAIAAEAHVADQPGVALFVTRATATLPAAATARPGQAAQLAQLARGALDELRASARRATLTGGAAEEHAWQEHAEPDARQVTATLSWTDTAGHTAETARAVVASDGQRIVAVTGECLASDTAPPALVTACRTALGTLDPGVPAASRIALGLAATADATADATAGAAGSGTTGTGASGTGAAGTGASGTRGVIREAPSMSAPRDHAGLDDGSFVLPPTTVALDPPKADRRPMFVGAGIILLAVTFWWNRKRRDRFEREDLHESARDGRPGRAANGARPRRTAARRPRDEDADDLQAAARGDAPDLRDPANEPDAPDAPPPARPAPRDTRN